MENWLSACKIILESLYLIAGHDIDEWVEDEVEGAMVKRHGFKKPSAKKGTDARCMFRINIPLAFLSILDAGGGA